MQSRSTEMMEQKKPTGKEKKVKPKSGWGGARPGTGPKPLEPKVRRSVGLSERQWAIYDALGGNDWLRGELDKKSQNTQKPVHGSLKCGA